jgi:hypothetical protein
MLGQLPPLIVRDKSIFDSNPEIAGKAVESARYPWATAFTPPRLCRIMGFPAGVGICGNLRKNGFAARRAKGG